jgi:signal transduction histidine kinase
MDRGTSGQGITPAQAQKLFVAFGRLDTHVKVEGTGLGLISARKIVEAHGGEVFVEGHQDGTADSPRFATATCSYPSLLPPGFLTGFVIALPVRQVRQDADKRQTPAARPVWSDH